MSGSTDSKTIPDFPEITKEELAEAKEFFPMEKFFIFGYKRSGTTLLNRLIRVHPQVHTNQQSHFFTRPPYLTSLVSDPQVQKWLKRHSFRWNRGADPSTAIMRSVSDFILERDARREGATLVGDKSPNSNNNGDALRQLHKIYPDTKVIYIIRDGRDAVVSRRIQSFIDGERFLSQKDLKLREDFVNDPDQFKSPHKSIFTRDIFRKYARNWKNNLIETVSEGNELFGESFQIVKFEDLLDDPSSVILGVWDFLGVDTSDSELKEAIYVEMSKNPDASWQESKASRIRKAVRKGKTGSWQDYFSIQDLKEFKKIAGEVLIEFNYEQDHTW